MDNKQLREKLDARRNEIEEELKLVRYQREDLDAKESVWLGRRDEISFAIEALDDLIFAVTAPAPCAPPAPAQAAEKTRLPSVECAEAIAAWIDRQGISSFTEANAFAALDGKFKTRTLRAALRGLVADGLIQEIDGWYRLPLLSTESRAGDSSLSPQEEPENPPVDGALARETDTEMPGFLKRSPKQAAE